LQGKDEQSKGMDVIMGKEGGPKMFSIQADDPLIARWKEPEKKAGC